MGNDVFGLIYTGESSMQLRDLTYSRSVAAVPFAGRYRCIDFIMSNLVNTGISNVGIIAQKNYHSLMDHLGSGREWDLARKHGGLNIVPPFAERTVTKIYAGRMEALASILRFLEAQKEKYVLMTDCFQALNMDFKALIHEHIVESIKSIRR